jgi:hypothetical protein
MTTKEQAKTVSDALDHKLSSLHKAVSQKQGGWKTNALPEYLVLARHLLSLNKSIDAEGDDFKQQLGDLYGKERIKACLTTLPKNDVNAEKTFYATLESHAKKYYDEYQITRKLKKLIRYRRDAVFGLGKHQEPRRLEDNESVIKKYIESCINEYQKNSEADKPISSHVAIIVNEVALLDSAHEPSIEEVVDTKNQSANREKTAAEIIADANMAIATGEIFNLNQAIQKVENIKSRLVSVRKNTKPYEDKMILNSIIDNASGFYGESTTLPNESTGTELNINTILHDLKAVKSKLEPILLKDPMDGHAIKKTARDAMKTAHDDLAQIGKYAAKSASKQPGNWRAWLKNRIDDFKGFISRVTKDRFKLNLGFKQVRGLLNTHSSIFKAQHIDDAGKGKPPTIQGGYGKR